VSEGHWTLEGFEDEFDVWAEREAPDDDLRFRVLSWFFTRTEDPYVGVRREPTFDNLWFGLVPGSLRSGTVVGCSYWIVESTRAIRCDAIATLALPM
jgi:hypothetical protein